VLRSYNGNWSPTITVIAPDKIKKNYFKSCEGLQRRLEPYNRRCSPLNSIFFKKKGYGTLDGDTKAVVISNRLCIVELNFKIVTAFLFKAVPF